MNVAPRVIREDEPEYGRLISEGWSEVSNSWGVRLNITKISSHLPLWNELIARIEAQGYLISEADLHDVDAICEFDLTTAADYPITAATVPELPANPEETRELFHRGWRVFVARTSAADPLSHGQIVAATKMYPLHDRWETDTTAVLPEHRERGIAEALKSFGLRSLTAEGVRRFGTGGAGVNEASLRANRRLGYELEPIWRHLVPPTTTAHPQQTDSP